MHRLMWQLLVPLVLHVLNVACDEAMVSHEYCIVGAGPAGLQLGYYLTKASRDYVIFEKSNVSGSFYTRYPVHDKLISINKRHTGKTNREFNLRHDWNSLITDDDDMLFRHYSREYFPRRQALLQYLNDFEKKYSLNVQHNTNIRDITPHAGDGKRWFTMRDQHGTAYICDTLIVATGVEKPNNPRFKGHEYAIGYENVPTDREFFEGKTVLILGRGNAAMEVALNIYGSTNLVHMMGRSRVRLSWETHYVGDIRGVNNEVLDSYMLKSLDGLLEAHVSMTELVKVGDKFHLVDAEDDYVASQDNFALREPYDVVIRCLGFKFDFDIFNSSSPTKPEPTVKPPGKYPRIDYGYESYTTPGMYFAGTASHSVDFRKSSGGFIHGFRYTARALHRLLEYKNHGVRWPSMTQSLAHLLNFALKRFNEASGTYQMFQLLSDVIILNKQQKTFTYLEEFPLNLLHQLYERTGYEAETVIVMVFEYGKTFSGPGNDNFRKNRATAEPMEGHLSNFLHPVFYYYDKLPTEADMTNRGKSETLPRPTRMHHVVEDFLTMWEAPSSHILPLRRFFEVCIDADLRQYFADQCFLHAMTLSTLPMTCDELYLKGQGLFI